jgi:hypothetical protein
MEKVRFGTITGDSSRTQNSTLGQAGGLDIMSFRLFLAETIVINLGFYLGANSFSQLDRHLYSSSPPFPLSINLSNGAIDLTKGTGYKNRIKS